MDIISEQLRITREALKGVKGKEEMLSIVCANTHKTSELFTYFNYDIHGHSYRGYIYNPYQYSFQGELYGTIFYLWDNSPYIVRGYPKILYAQVPIANVLGREVGAEEKVDGTNLIFFDFPNGQTMGKTRAVPRYDLGGYQGRMWNELAGNTGRMSGIREITKQGYHPVVELYGSHNPCEYIDYPDIAIDMKGLDIIDSRTFSFVPYDKKKILFDNAGIPMPKLQWRGILNQNSLTYLKNQAESLMGKYEGFIVKYWSSLYKDQFFGKIKCDAMLELARLRSGSLPPTEIHKAIRKSLDNLPMISSVSELHSMVLEELYSEFNKNYVDASMLRVERAIAKEFPIDTITLWTELDSLSNIMPITLANKGKILAKLSQSSSMFKSNPKQGYKGYLLYLRKNGIDK